MGRDVYRRSARVRVLVQMTEEQFMRVVDEVHRLYINQANEVVQG
jgi:RNase P subunit RPR2